MLTSPIYLAFDVESIGLHGEGFAVGWHAFDDHNEPISVGRHACPPEYARGADSDHQWVAENVPLTKFSWDSPREVRDIFWRMWMDLKSRGATLWADCSWPVEARFLAACIDDDPENRRWDGPYPLHDVATLRLAAGFDPLATCERRADELPAHDPYKDAVQSARLLWEAVEVLKGREVTCG